MGKIYVGLINPTNISSFRNKAVLLRSREKHAIFLWLSTCIKILGSEGRNEIMYAQQRDIAVI